MSESSSSAELAWAAGFWDGEGHCGIVSPRKSKAKTMVLDLSQSFSPECLIRFQNAVEGLGKIRGPLTRCGNSNQFWIWRTNREKHVHRVMELLLPYLSSPKREQYERVAEVRAASVAHIPVVNKPTKEELERMYWVESMTLEQIGNLLGVTPQCISKWMKGLNIATRGKTPV